jgi:hypothetical protein
MNVTHSYMPFKVTVSYYKFLDIFVYGTNQSGRIFPGILQSSHSGPMFLKRSICREVEIENVSQGVKSYKTQVRLQQRKKKKNSNTE